MRRTAEIKKHVLSILFPHKYSRITRMNTYRDSCYNSDLFCRSLDFYFVISHIYFLSSMSLYVLPSDFVLKSRHARFLFLTYNGITRYHLFFQEITLYCLLQPALYFLFSLFPAVYNYLFQVSKQSYSIITCILCFPEALSCYIITPSDCYLLRT